MQNPYESYPAFCRMPPYAPAMRPAPSGFCAGKDFMININADILTHAASAGKAAGADEAAKYYHRNLVMYSNLNRLPLTRDDRVFILMGASHTAFFNEFMNRSPKYEPVDAAAYLQ